MTVVGPHICVSGAIWLDKPIVQPLTNYIHMVEVPDEPEKCIEQVVQVLSGLRAAVEQLDTYYREAVDEKEIEQDAQWIPYLRDYVDPTFGKIRLSYSSQVGDKLVTFYHQVD